MSLIWILYDLCITAKNTVTARKNNNETEVYEGINTTISSIEEYTTNDLLKHKLMNFYEKKCKEGETKK